MTTKMSELRVEHFMTKNPVMAHSNVNFPGGIDIMTTNSISNLIVIENMKPIGILTEREILHYLTTYRLVPAEKKLKDISLQPFCEANPDTSILDAARKMITKKCRILVFDKSNSRDQDNDQKVVGIITASDMIRAFAEQNDKDPSLKSVMTKRIFFVSADDPIYDAVDIMNNKNVGSVIVVADSKSDSSDSKKEMYGIFTERDLLKRVLSNDVSLYAHIKDYCSTELLTADMGISAVEAAKIMLLKKIKRLPIVTGSEVKETGESSRAPEIIEKGGKRKLAGIVTARDLVEIFQSNS
jgi:CBS domain-containing protein